MESLLHEGDLVTPRKGVNESFSTDSTCSISNDEDNNTDPGLFSGFRHRRMERMVSRAVQKQHQKKIQEAIPERLIEVDPESLRAGRISVTVVKSDSNVYGMGLAQSGKAVVKIDALVPEGLLQSSPLQVGDVLKSVNGKVVKEYRPVMLELMKMDGPVTMVAEPSVTEDCNPAMVHAFARNPTKDLGIQFQVMDHSITQNVLCGDLGGSQDVVSMKLLQIQSVDQDGFLAHSSLSPGDIVLAINDTPCTDKTAEEANALLQEQDTLSILALNPKLAQEHFSPTRAQKWLRRARKTGVGVAGGTMVGLGLIMIPLPLPPGPGEVLVASGVTVLGTEFEGPKQMMRSARNAIQNAVSRDDERVATEQLKQMESADDSPSETDDGQENNVVLRDSFFTMSSESMALTKESTEPYGEALPINDCWSEANIDADIGNMYGGNEHVEASTSPKSTRKFLKNVGRNLVLPFLDHVVGDAKGTRGAGETQPPSIDPTPDECPDSSTTDTNEMQ